MNKLYNLSRTKKKFIKTDQKSLKRDTKLEMLKSSCEY